MGAELLLGVRLTSQSLKTIKLNDVDLKTKVENLRVETAVKTELPKDSFELIYCGCILEDDVTLESCGLKNGAMVHVLKKKEPEKPVPAKSISEGSIFQIASAFRSFVENPALRSALHRLSKRPEVIENIILTTPGLSDDPVAIAMLQDPDLMAHFTDSDTVKRIAELHPILVEAAQLIATAVHEEAHNSAASGPSSSTMTAPSTAYSYSLDNLSDDEEMAGDSSQSSDSAQHNASSGTGGGAAITTAQLAVALSRAGAGTGVGARSFPLSSSSSSTSTGSLNSVITTEMFNQAMQQAFASASNISGLPPMPPTLPQASDLQPQLAQMHEIGLHDDSVNIQALQFTNGDVQAAIDLVFSGFSDN
ncbi:ubiquitin-like protein 7 [Chelonus insularis]|uniref:ubiquitin-like protein 7 n=1 Tax=Chelonus insularis TaxID=460826 RepID=UPI00158C7CAD|nr:ubiquitin-like protein 7 [Chelonus insularis]